jgi:hypothetical protein
MNISFSSALSLEVVKPVEKVWKIGHGIARVEGVTIILLRWT